MSRDNPDIEAVISGLEDFQKKSEVERLLDEALQAPIVTEDRLRQVEQILEAFKALGLLGQDEGRDLHLLLTVGQTYERFSHLEKAFETFTAALSLAERLDDQETRALVLCRMGRVLSRWSRWEEAEDHFAKSRGVCERLEDRAGMARVALNLGIVRHERGDYPAAAEAYEEAADHARSADDDKLAADALNNLAVLATIRGDLDGAVRQYEACLATFEKLADQLGQARTLHNLGMTLADCKDWKGALDAYERGFKLAGSQGHIDVMANIHLGSAEVLLELGGTSMALCYCARALDIYRQTGDRLGEADTYRLLGKGFSRNREWTKAEGMFRHSLRINEEFDNPLGVAETQMEVGRMHASRGLIQDARVAIQDAMDAFKTLGAVKDAAEAERLMEDLGTP